MVKILRLVFYAFSRMRDGAVMGLNFIDEKNEIANCETCSRGKLPFGKSESRSKQILDFIHSDLFGPMETASIDEAKYIPNFLDDHLRKVFTYFLNRV